METKTVKTQKSIDCDRAKKAMICGGAFGGFVCVSSLLFAPSALANGLCFFGLVIVVASVAGFEIVRKVESGN